MPIQPIEKDDNLQSTQTVTFQKMYKKEKKPDYHYPLTRERKKRKPSHLSNLRFFRTLQS